MITTPRPVSARAHPATRVMLTIGWLLVPGFLIAGFYLGLTSNLIVLLVLVLSVDAMRARKAPPLLFSAVAVLLLFASVTGILGLARTWWLAYTLRLGSVAAVIGGIVGLLWRRLRRG